MFSPLKTTNSRGGTEGGVNSHILSTWLHMLEGRSYILRWRKTCMLWWRSRNILRGTTAFLGDIFSRCRIFQCRMLKSENPEIASPSPSKIFRSDIASEYPCYRALFQDWTCAPKTSHDTLALLSLINKIYISIFCFQLAVPSTK